MGDLIRFPRRPGDREAVLPLPSSPIAVPRPRSAAYAGTTQPPGWPDKTPVVDKLTGRTGIVVGRGWSLNFLGVRTYSVRWDDRPHLPADVVFASRLMQLRPTPCGAVVRLPDGRTLRRLPDGATGAREATWVPAPEFDDLPPSAA